MKPKNTGRQILTLSLVALLSSCGREDQSSLKSQAYQGSNFSAVWSEVQLGAYPETQLAEYETSYSKFFEGSVNLLERAVNRTLSTSHDTLPRFQKLVHPIGICFAGTWSITEDSPYTGYFANGSKAIIIMRASEAMGNPTAADWRAFGLAGKIYPTTNEQDPRLLRTANFFTVDDLGGTDSKSFFDLPKTNKPDSSIHASALFMLRTLKEIVSVFSAADKDPGIRQLYPIAELGLKVGQKALAPIGFMLKSESNQRTGMDDFRQELQLKHHANGLNFGIYTSDAANPIPRRLGKIQLTKDALSDGCDHRLHFPHPRTR